MIYFERTCAGCPETYDIKVNNTTVGEIRLRWGVLCAFIGNEMVYKHVFNDRHKGVMDREESDFYLREIRREIIE